MLMLSFAWCITSIPHALLFVFNAISCDVLGVGFFVRCICVAAALALPLYVFFFFILFCEFARWLAHAHVHCFFFFRFYIILYSWSRCSSVIPMDCFFFFFSFICTFLLAGFSAIFFRLFFSICFCSVFTRPVLLAYFRFWFRLNDFNALTVCLGYGIHL